MIATAPQTNYERLNISKLAFRFDLDRATVRKRITDATIEPVDEKAKEKIYNLTPKLEAILNQTNAKLDDAKLRKESAMARLKEIEVAEAEGEMAPVSEFMDAVQKLFHAMYQEMTVRQPQRLANKLAKARTAVEVTQILKADTSNVFSRLRSDHEKFLKK